MAANLPDPPTETDDRIQAEAEQLLTLLRALDEGEQQALLALLRTEDLERLIYPENGAEGR